MGEFMVRGPNALDLIQKVTSNDASKLFDGKVQYSCFPNESGGIVDDLLVYRMGEEEYLLVVNGSNIDKDWAWVNRHNDVGAELENISDEISLLAVQGPKALDVMANLTELNLGEMKYYSLLQGNIAGIENVIISTTGYTGAGGFEIYVENENASVIWDAVMKAGESREIHRPCDS